MGNKIQTISEIVDEIVADLESQLEMKEISDAS